MELRLIEKEEYAEALHLWESVFPEDEGAFAAYYFKYRTRPEYVAAAFENGRMISALHMIPQKLGCFSREIPCCMVAGVGTLAGHRKRGIARALLAFADGVMEERGFSLAVLQPFDTAFYEKSGYRVFVRCMEHMIMPERLAHIEPTALFRPNAAELMRIYSRFAQEYEGMLIRDEAFSELRLTEVETYGFSVTDGENYALCTREEGELFIFELAGETPLPLLSALARDHGALRVRTPVDFAPLSGTEGVIMPFNMLKTLDGRRAEAMLARPAEALFDSRAYSFECY